MSDEKDNELVWDGAKKGHYEVYYLKFNQAKTKTAWWIRFTLNAPLPGKGDPIAELWGIFFDGNDFKRNAAFKKTIPFAEASIGRNPHQFKIGSAVLKHNESWGKLDGNGRSLEWDLKMTSEGGTFRHFPYPGMYTGKLPKTKVLSPHMNGRFSGTIKVDGQTYSLVNEPGQQTHIWGTKHAYRWVWGHCNLFKEDPGAVLELLSAQIKIGPIPTPVISVFHLVHRGKAYTVNRIGESLRVKSRWDVGKWNFAVATQDRRFEIEVNSRLENFVGVEYTDPDLEHAYCYNTKIADCRVSILEPKDGEWVPSGVLTSDGGAAFEVAQRNKDPRVAVRI
ncbi:MAG: hypothetical protein HYT87_08275 [Nitrospirae bacterium]|nr:hypothetical protein [Nitrospirota bacterium]